MASFLARLRSADEGKFLEPILTFANPKASLVERMDWLADLLRWIRGGVLTGGRPIVRVRFLLGRLDRNDDERARFTATLSSLVTEVRSVDLLASAGVPSRFHFFGELVLRAHRAILPTALIADDFAAVLPVLLPAEADAQWISELDDATLARLRALFDAPSQERLDHDAADAVRVLAALSEAEALDRDIRERLGEASVVEALSVEVTRAIADKTDPTPAVSSLRAKVAAAIAALDEEGASIDLTYRLDRLQARLDRLLLLLPAVLTDHLFDPRKVLATIVREGILERRFAGLLRRSTNLLARKVIEHSAEVGKHYIATDRSEYFHMLRAAMGGGLLMGFATVAKLKIASLELPTIYDGLFAGINYAATFVAIQALGFSVATKQPASTAPALAASLAEADAPKKFASEVARLIRSQVAAIVGNVSLVIPTALGLDLLHKLIFGTHAVTVAKGEKIISTLSVLGPTPLYAIWTGILLWITAILAGTVANWLAFHKVRRGLATSRTVRRVLGAERAQDIAERFVKAAPGVSGNVFLGMLLGLLPAAATILKLPIDIRHVTVGSGMVTVATAAAPPTFSTLGTLSLAIFGALVVGVLNVASSFVLALSVALRARPVHAPGDELLGAVLQHFVHRTREFFLPPKS